MLMPFSYIATHLIFYRKPATPSQVASNEVPSKLVTSKSTDVISDLTVSNPAFDKTDKEEKHPDSKTSTT